MQWMENEESSKPLDVAFDVDGTLIHQVGEAEDTPRYDIIALFLFIGILNSFR